MRLRQRQSSLSANFSFPLLLLFLSIPSSLACDPAELNECVRRPEDDDTGAENRTLDATLLQHLLGCSTEAKVLHVCREFEAALPCVEQRVEQCGSVTDRAAAGKVRRLLAFICADEARDERITLSRGASCADRVLFAHLPATCPVSTTIYAPKMAVCRSKCASYNTSCRESIDRSHRAICAVIRVRNQCGGDMETTYVRMQQAMLANDFPIECDGGALSATAAAINNRVDEALRSSFWQRRRTIRTKPPAIIGRKTTAPFTIPIRRFRVTTPRTLLPRITRPPPRPTRRRPATLLWNRLLLSSPKTTTTTTATTTQKPSPRTKRPRNKSSPEKKNTKRAPAPVTTTTQKTRTTTRLPPKTTTQATNVTKKWSTLTAEEILGPLLGKEFPWRPVHWLSGARPIPDSVLAAHFLNWRLKPPAPNGTISTMAKPLSVEQRKTTMPVVVESTVSSRKEERPEKKRPKFKKRKESGEEADSRESLIENFRRVSEKTGAGWRLVRSILGGAAGEDTVVAGGDNSTEPLTGIRGAMERLKSIDRNSGDAAEALARSLNKVLTALSRMIESIPPESAERIRRGVRQLQQLFQNYKQRLEQQQRMQLIQRQRLASHARLNVRQQQQQHR